MTVTVPDSGNVYVSVTSATTSDSNSTSCVMSYTTTGVPGDASDATAVILAGQGGGQSPTLQRASAASLLTGLTAGQSITLTAEYRAEAPGTAGTCTFSNRTIIALPIP